MERELLTTANCQEIIKKCYGKDNEIVKVNYEQAMEFGIMGTYYRVEIVAQIAGERVSKVCFLKHSASSNPYQDGVIRQMGLARKEYFVYEILLKNTPKIPRFSAECYLFTDDNIIVMEHLHETGYKNNINFISGLSDGEMKAVIKSLACLHASSIVFEDNKSPTYRLTDEYSEYFNEPLYLDEPEYPGNKILKTSTAAVLALMDLSTVFPDREAAKQFFQQTADQFYDWIRASEDCRNVCCHGDLWHANFMFKYSDHIRCKLVDFQMLRYCSPAHDICALIYGMLTKEQRSQHDSLMDFYYECLRENLRDHGIDIFNCITRDAFLRECERLKPFIVAQKAMMSTMAVMVYNERVKAVGDLFCEFMYEDRRGPCAAAYRDVPEFRALVDQALRELADLM